MTEIFGGERLENTSTRGKSSQMALVRGYCLLKGPPRLVASFWPAIKGPSFFFSFHPPLPPLASWWLTSWKLRCVKWPLLYHLAPPLPIFIPVTQVIFPQAVTVVAPVAPGGEAAGWRGGRGGFTRLRGSARSSVDNLIRLHVEQKKPRRLWHVNTSARMTKFKVVLLSMGWISFQNSTRQELDYVLVLFILCYYFYF